MQNKDKIHTGYHVRAVINVKKKLLKIIIVVITIIIIIIIIDTYNSAFPFIIL